MNLFDTGGYLDIWDWSCKCNKESQICNVRKMAKIRNRYNQAPHLTPGYQWESDNVTIRHHKREPRGQPFPSR